MPFRPVQNAGAPDPRLAQLLFNARRQPMQDERQAQIDQQNAMIAQQKAQREAQEHRLKIANQEADLLAKFRTADKDFSAAADTAAASTQARQGAANVSARRDLANSPGAEASALPGGQGFEEIVLQNDPGFGASPEELNRIRQIEFGPLNARINRASEIEGAATGQDPSALAALRRSEVGLLSDTTKRLENKKAAAELQKTMAKERRSEATAIRKEMRAEQRSNRTALRDIGMIAQKEVEKAFGEVQAANALGETISDLRKQISAAKEEGTAEGAAKAEELEGILLDTQQVKANVLSSGQINVQPSIPPNLLDERVSKLHRADRGLARIGGIARDMDSGAIKPGTRGWLENYRQRFIGNAADILGDSNVDQDVKDLISETIKDGKTTFTIEDRSGKQLTLGLDQLAIAYDFVNSQRDSARFTLLELETTLAELNMTKLFGTESEIRGNMGKVARELMRNRNAAENTLMFFGIDPEQFAGTADLTPDQQSVVDSIMGRTKTIQGDGSGGTSTPTPRADGTFSPEAVKGMTDEQLLELR